MKLLLLKQFWLLTHHLYLLLILLRLQFIKERVIGMHFFNPAPVMKLVEVIRALQTSDEVVKAVRELTEKIGKTAVDVKDSYGFVLTVC